ncbi:hypothetical protein NDU88_002609 [Pleurodeles waltl]|uniref:Uncharacterized protein n=1 Tax=Pleurodeles waltl TaxID=8319 RepID=A0AAV7NFW4_PLEWA|nr:hypothetical protein NDU88_002609 [Pleurodeles waltl]
MDSTISVLEPETKSICLDIAGFQSRVSDLEQRETAVEDHLSTIPERNQELLFLRSKLIDLEDNCHRDSCFFSFTEHIEGTNIRVSLLETLPNLKGLSFDPPLEFQRAHHRGSKQIEGSRYPRPIIACLLRHTQIHIAADFSKETNKHRKAFVSLRPHLCQLEVKYGLFELAHMWVTKNGQSKDFYDPEDLQLYLDDLPITAMNLSPQNLPSDMTKDSSDALLLHIPSEERSLCGRGTHQRVGDPKRLPGPNDDRGKALLTVVHSTQQTDRGKSRSPQKTVPAPT